LNFPSHHRFTHTHEHLTCRTCEKTLPVPVNYCPACGVRVKNWVSQELKWLYPLLVYFFLNLLVICIYKYSNLVEDTFENMLYADGIISSITLIFVAIFYNDLMEIFKLQKLSLNPLAKMIALVVAGAVVVNFLANYISQALYEEIYYYTLIFTDYPYPVLYAILFVCLQPAIFEELAFRGFLFRFAEKLSSPKTAILVTALLFGIMHMDLIALLWLLPLGYVFGYFRYKYKSIWYGVIGHFVYNLVILLFEFKDLYFS